MKGGGAGFCFHVRRLFLEGQVIVLGGSEVACGVVGSFFREQGFEQQHGGLASNGLRYWLFPGTISRFAGVVVSVSGHGLWLLESLAPEGKASRCK